MYKYKKNSKPTGWIISLATLPFGLVPFILSAVLSWNLLREIYCRSFPSSQLLCHYIGWDFRPDIVFVVLAASGLYLFFHFMYLKKITLNSHLKIILGLILLSVLLKLMIFMIPGNWEAWY